MVSCLLLGIAMACSKYDHQSLGGDLIGVCVSPAPTASLFCAVLPWSYWVAVGRVRYHVLDVVWNGVGREGGGNGRFSCPTFVD